MRCFSLIAILCCLTGCFDLFSSNKADLAPVRIADGQHIGFGLIYIAAAKGYFEEQGLQPTYRHFKTSREALTDLNDGNSDVAGTFLTFFVTLLREKADLGALSTLHKSDRYMGLVVRKDRGILQPNDLVRRRIGTVPGSVAEHFLDLLLRSNGLQTKQIIKVNIPTPDLIDRLKKGDIDGATLWGHHLLRAQNMKDLATTTFHTDAYSEMSVLAIRRDSRLSTETQRKLMRALLKAENFAKKSPREALEIILDHLPAENRDANREVWTRIHLRLRLDNILLAALEDENDWLSLTQKNGVPLDFRKALFNQPLEAEQPLAVTVQ